MSRGCYKSYGRKVNGPANASIQFDKLFCENSNKPSASKSAGTVGKWGITSFTSLRHSNFTVGTKRSRDKPKDVTNKPPEVVEAPMQPRPKKFFKSRNTEEDKSKHAIAPHAPPRVASTLNKKSSNSSPAPPPRSYVKTTNRPTRSFKIKSSKNKTVTVQFLKRPLKNFPTKWSTEVKRLMEKRGITEDDLLGMKKHAENLDKDIKKLNK